MTCLILSLDGGGIRGVLTAQLLARLEQQAPFLEQVDLFAGTSTGGILALGLANGMAPGELVDFYRQDGAKIFGDRDLLDKLAGKADELVRADYGTEPLRKVLEHHFRDKKLGELDKKVLIPTFDLDAPEKQGVPRQWRPKFLHNYEGSSNDGAVSMVDAALRSSAPGGRGIAGQIL